MAEGIFIFGTRRTIKDKIKSKLKLLRDRIDANERDGRSPVFGDKTPFAVAKVEDVIKRHAAANDITIAGNVLCMSEDKLLHAVRTAKQNANKAVSEDDIANFPKNISRMDLYFDKAKNNYVYVQGFNKFVVEPNYKVKMSNGKIRSVLIITIDKVNGVGQYSNGNQYIKLK